MGAECSTEKICDPDKMMGFETAQKKEKEKFGQQRPPTQHASAQYDYNDGMPPRHQESSYVPMQQPRHVETQSPAQKRHYRIQRLMAAAEQGQFLAIDQVLSESLADREDIVNETDDMDDTALHKAARKGHVMACRNLLQVLLRVYACVASSGMCQGHAITRV